METWQEWYLANQSAIDRETEQSNEADIYDPVAHESLTCKYPTICSKISVC